jgi:hypothetical protein
MKFVTFIAVLILFVTNCFGQRSKKDPLFEDFSVTVFQDKVASVKLQSHPKAKTYRTMLRLYVKDGVNFAGHYIIGTWGCGSNCLTIAIIDGKTGNVFFPSEFFNFGQGFEFKEGNEESTLQFKPNSNLIIAEGILGFETDASAKAGKYYFVWKDNHLQLVYKEKRQWVNSN